MTNTDETVAFSDAEINAIRKFFHWIDHCGWLDTDEGLVGFSDEGALVQDFGRDPWDGARNSAEPSYIPLIALTDPGEYSRQCEEAEAEERQRREEAIQAEQRWQDARERREYERLKSKFGL